jgi:regulator of protease activity HflC (stomatin/prohibitin superfamily)
MMPIFVAFVLVLGVVTVFKAVRVVPQGFEWTGRALRQVHPHHEPGLHFLMPWMQRVGRKVNMMEQVLEVPARTSSPRTTRW